MYPRLFLFASSKCLSPIPIPYLRVWSFKAVSGSGLFLLVFSGFVQAEDMFFTICPRLLKTPIFMECGWRSTVDKFGQRIDH